MAAFVGFAERGPLDLPVPVEDYATYQAIFGHHLPLAQGIDGQIMFANLPRVVNAFFEQGGRRCYVVRVAGRNAATAILPLPGLVGVDEDGDITPASLSATSPGTWANQLRMTLRLAVRPLPTSDFVLDADGPISLKSGSAAEAIQPGELLRLSLDDGSSRLAAISPVYRGDPDRVNLAIDRAWVEPSSDVSSGHVGPPIEGSPPGYLASVERLRFDLQVSLADRTLLIRDLGFNREHPRFWADVCLRESSLLRTGRSGSEPLEMGQFTDPDQLTARNAALFRKLQTGARIDPVRDGEIEPVLLAGLVASLGESSVGNYLPAGMSERFDPDTSKPPIALGTDDLDRYDARTALLFLDRCVVPPFTGGSPAALSADAFDRTYVQERRLTGLHSLFFVDDVAMISVADASHPNWTPGDSSVPESATADLPDQPPPPAGVLDVCLDAPTIDRIEPDHASAPGGAVVDVFGTNFVAGATTVLFGSRTSIDVLVLDRSHLRCVAPAMQAVESSVVARTDGGRSDPVPFTFVEPDDSATLGALAPVEDFSLDTSPLLVVHRAMVTFCAARADVTAILTLPKHFDRGEAIDWQRSLSTTANLSYASAYHPWLMLRDATSSRNALMVVPPDGHVCGLMATRERDRQVWAAPANEALVGVLGLEPDIADDDWAGLLDAGINLVRRQPRDFRPMSARTLSDDPSLLQLSTRRLLILLRKLLLGRGGDYVFEANHQRFRTLTRIAMEDVLRTMFDGGAFAGRTPPESYRVVADASVNPPQSLDQGRLVVRIQVAPSQPMEFITVQLTRAGTGQLVAAEA